MSTCIKYCESIKPIKLLSVIYTWTSNHCSWSRTAYSFHWLTNSDEENHLRVSQYQWKHSGIRTPRVKKSDLVEQNISPILAPCFCKSEQKLWVFSALLYGCFIQWWTNCGFFLEISLQMGHEGEFWLNLFSLEASSSEQDRFIHSFIFFWKEER